MPSFSQTILNLINTIQEWSTDDANTKSNTNTNTNTNTNSVRFSEAVDVPVEFNLIDWLDPQPIYPKIYWQSRDEQEEVVALGCLCSYQDPTLAYRDLCEQQRVWGVNAFDQQKKYASFNSFENPAELAEELISNYFFLPQIELIKNSNQWSLNINVTHPAVEQIIEQLQKLILDVSILASIVPQNCRVSYIPKFDEWKEILNTALQAIDNKEFEKVVLARKAEVKLIPSESLNMADESNHKNKLSMNAAQLLKMSSENNQRSFHFLFAPSPHSAFVGSTPERLYFRSGDQLLTEALAGTIASSEDMAENQELADWLLNDEKNGRENQIVVDDIIARLSPLCSNVMVKPETELVTLRKVQHLKRHINAQLSDGVQGIKILSVLQPTAAIAGLPRQAALNFINKHEPFKRGWYSGSVGYYGLDKAEFCVAIRSAVITDDKLALYAGAGIVAGSQAESEWQELDRKTSTLLSFIAKSDEKQMDP